MIGVIYYVEKYGAFGKEEPKTISPDFIEKWISFNYVTNRYVISAESIKTTTLEWTLTSPPYLHTFVVPPKLFTTGKHYFEYRWNAILNKKRKFIPLYIGKKETRNHFYTTIYITYNPLVSNWKIFGNNSLTN
jgi:hypothetical protein